MMAEVTDTDRKIFFSDHDLLVRLNTLMETNLKQWDSFTMRYEQSSQDILQRVAKLEVGQGVVQTLVENNKSEIDTLRKRGNFVDGINAAATAIVAAIMFIWKGGS